MAVSGGIGGIGLLPAFALPGVDGRRVRSWDYKGRSPVEDVPDFAEARSWLAYINLLEPECGCCAPCWPDAEPGGGS
jgi:hypothetical protein